jgi:hypothetical protein
MGPLTRQPPFSDLYQEKEVMMSTNGNERPDGMRRRVLPGGIIEEESAAMGRVFTIPASPTEGRKIDLSDGAAGWERLRTLLRGRRV